ncbi:hypothetical protein KVR01_000346 [Diaporthe batatas]|uniref:uncharacterized protein n=1 Tax=Diaporthe batatas TaxID=748121 RepID=UPI001D03C8F4|nr:uncharacterized protein KVR01_000346 [Diaporthe batatas]KAG8169601.1 hypothetical protein KVR01_000346 [Diaporthe batatas]
MDFKNFVQIINGKSAPTEKTRHGINPATLEPNAEVPVATQDDVDRAVTAAKAAFKTWSKTPFEKRREAVLAYADAVESHLESFHKLLTAENGKPTVQAAFEAQGTVAWIRSIGGLDLPEDIVEENEKKTTYKRYTPLGVVGAIVPWNGPLLLAAGKIAPAVLTGNVIIVKPSPFTPYTGLKLVELAQQFFPPGVVQSLSGDESLGPWITSHPGVDKISFTGSTATGKAIMRSASATLKRLTLELGGNDPAIIFPDVDVESVAQQIAAFAFINTGQICVAVKRIYVHEDIYAPFKKALVKAASQYVFGDGSQPGITHGPLQNRMQYDRVKTFFDDIPKEGWEVALGGETVDENPKKGYFIKPTIIDRPPEKSRIVVEEPFGPIVPLLTWKDEEDVISRANDTAAGLGASVWSKDVSNATRVGKQIEAGNVWINGHADLSPIATFGGHKESGIGAEWGVTGLIAYCNVQTLVVNK